MHALFPVLLSREGFSYAEYGVGVIFLKKINRLKEIIIIITILIVSE